MKKMFKNSSWIILGAIFLLSLSPTKTDYLLGKWISEKYGVEMLIFKKGVFYYGNVTEAGNRRGNEKLKNGEVMQVLQNFKKTSDSTYCCGTLYIPRTKTRLKASIELKGNKNLTVIGSILGIRTYSHWKKIE